MSDNLDFLDGDAPAEPTAAVEQEPAEQPAEAHGQPRGPDGKFVSKGEAAEPEPAQPDAPQPAPAQAQPETPATPPPGYVPLAVVNELRSEIRALKQPQQQQAFQPEDMTPEELGSLQALNTRLDLSEELARDKFGDELVNAAQAWALEKYQTSPAFKAEVLSQRNPYRYVVEAYKAEQRASKLNDLADDDIEAFLAWKAARQATPAAAPAAPPPQPTPPPRSLASTPNAGGTKPGEEPVYPGAAFDEVFRN